VERIGVKEWEGGDGTEEPEGHNGPRLRSVGRSG